MGITKTFLALLACLIWWLPAATPAWADGLDGPPPLREAFDPGLQAGLERTLRGLGLAPAAADGKLAVALVDVTDPEDPRLASVNGDRMLYAASLPKIAILLGAFVEVERGRLALDGPTRQSLEDMIRVSSNPAATRMLKRVGEENLLRILQSDRFRLYDPDFNGGLWIGKAFGKAPAYRRDPLHNISHGATAIQTARFYYLLQTGQMFGPALTRQMKAILADPAIEHKFVKGLARFPGARLYRKSGSWRQWHSDSALVEQGGYRYIAVALAEHPEGGRWMEDLIAALHRLIVPADVAGAGG